MEHPGIEAPPKDPRNPRPAQPELPIRKQPDDLFESVLWAVALGRAFNGIYIPTAKWKRYAISVPIACNGLRRFISAATTLTISAKC